MTSLPSLPPTTTTSAGAPAALRAEPPADEVHISRAAELTGSTMRALRYYDGAGIVEPSGRNRSGHRLYSPGDIRRLRWVKPVQSMGLCREDLIEVLDLLEAGREPTSSTGGGGLTGEGEERWGAAERRQLFASIARERLASLREEVLLLEQVVRDLSPEQIKLPHTPVLVRDQHPAQGAVVWPSAPELRSDSRT